MVHYKLVVLIIAHDHPAYKEFDTIWRENIEYNKSLSNDIKFFFLYNVPGRKERVGDNLYFPNEETYPNPGLILKTLGGIQYLRENDITYDMLFRTNLSSFINLPKLLEYVDANKDRKLFYSGGRYYLPKHVAGCSMLFSKDLLAYVVENSSKLNLNIQDDHCINTLLLSSGLDITYETIPGIGISPNINMEEHKNKVYFRFWYVNNNRDDRSSDSVYMRKLHKIINP